MAPLPPNSTPRYKIFYTGNGVQHSQEWRSHLSPLAFTSMVEAFWDAMDPLLFATTIDDVQFAADGSNIFNSVTSGIVGNTYGSGSTTITNLPNFISFIGRSSDGRRLRVYWYNTNAIGVDFRFVAGENADIDATIAALVSAAGGIVTIGDLAPVWKSYANAGLNAYWQRNARP